MRKISILFAVLIFSFSATSQNLSPELVSSSGDSFSNATYQLDWSLGECITITHSTTTYVITQGFHQDKYTTSIGIQDYDFAIDMDIFPNPTTDFIDIIISSDDLTMISNFSITDTHGKILLNGIINETNTKLNFSEYASGVYFLNIKKNNQIIRYYKIVKQ